VKKTQTTHSVGFEITATLEDKILFTGGGGGGGGGEGELAYERGGNS